MAGATVLSAMRTGMDFQHGFAWYWFSVALFWLGLILTIVFAIRAAVMTRQANTVRLWRRQFHAPARRAVARRRQYH